MPRTRAQLLNDYIRLVIDAGKQDDLSDQGICALALDLDPHALFIFDQGQFTISFTDRSRAVYDQVPQCP